MKGSARLRAISNPFWAVNQTNAKHIKTESFCAQFVLFCREKFGKLRNESRKGLYYLNDTRIGEGEQTS